MQTYYVIRVAPRSELKFLQQARPLLAQTGGEVLFPRRKLTVRKLGKTVDTESPLFPGYLFLMIEGMDAQTYWELKAVSGFVNFLRQGTALSTLTGKDLEILKHFLQFGEIIGRSDVVFDEDTRIRVVRGPLEGMEGQIVKVDRRKKRARIRVDFHHNSFTMDLAFQDITEQEKV